MAGLAGGAARAAQPGRDVVRFIPESALSAPDPIAQPTMAGRAHALMVWDQLFGMPGDPREAPRPQMVAGHEVSPDGLVWRFTLREGLVFHDGRAVRAADCLASIRRWCARRAFGRELARRVTAWREVSARQFEIRLQRPFPLMLAALAEDLCFIMPEDLAQTNPAEPVARIVGSGPFRFLADAYAPGGRAAYARFRDYVPAEGAADFTAGAKRAVAERVEWLGLEPGAALAAMRDGAADWWENPPPDQHEALGQLPGVTVRVNQAASVIPALVFNQLVPPFNDRRLLRALLPALDQLAFMTAALASKPVLYRTGVGIFTPGAPCASDAGLEALTSTRDMTAAQRDVQQSGYAGEPVLLLSPTDVPRLRAMTEVASDLFQQVGLIVEVAEMDWATLMQRRQRGDLPDAGGWNAFCTTFSGLALASPATHPALSGAADQRWFGWPGSSALTQLRAAWFDAPSARQRQLLCAQMQTAALLDLPYLPLGEWFGAMAVRDDLPGVGETPVPVFWQADPVGG